MHFPKKMVAFSLLSLLMVLAGICAYFVLPDRFFNDAFVINKDLYNEKGWLESYPITMMFYEVTGLNRLPFPIVALIQLPILLYVLYKIGVPDRFERFTLKNLLAYTTLMLVAIFISMPSKEFINFLVMALIPFFLSKKPLNRSATIMLCMLVFVAFGLWFRLYFALIPILALAMFLFSKIKMRNKSITIILISLLTGIALSLSYGFVKGEYLSQSTREELNLFRQNSSEAESMIESPLPVDTWYGESVGIAYGFFSVNLPVNGLRFLLKPQVIAFVLWQLLIFGFLVYLFAHCLKRREYYRYEIWIFYFLFSYFVVQGIFEPDLGSAVKHKMGVFPLIYFALYYDYFRTQHR